MRLKDGSHLIVETKGFDELAEVKAPFLLLVPPRPLFPAIYLRYGTRT